MTRKPKLPPEMPQIDVCGEGWDPAEWVEYLESMVKTEVPDKGRAMLYLAILFKTGNVNRAMIESALTPSAVEKLRASSLGFREAEGMAHINKKSQFFDRAAKSVAEGEVVTTYDEDGKIKSKRSVYNPSQGVKVLSWLDKTNYSEETVETAKGGVLVVPATEDQDNWLDRMLDRHDERKAAKGPKD